MNQGASTLFHEGLAMVAVVGGPMFGILFILGLALGVLQAATQINDPAVGFLPRIVAAIVVAGAMGGWMAERMAGYLRAALESMATGG